MTIGDCSIRKDVTAEAAAKRDLLIAAHHASTEGGSQTQLERTRAAVSSRRALPT